MWIQPPNESPRHHLRAVCQRLSSTSELRETRRIRARTEHPRESALHAPAALPHPANASDPAATTSTTESGR